MHYLSFEPFRTTSKMKDSKFSSKKFPHVEEENKEIVCSICNIKVSREEQLKLHMASVHKVEKPYKCIICNSHFSQKGAMTRHMVIVHEKKSLTSVTSVILLTPEWKD